MSTTTDTIEEPPRTKKLRFSWKFRGNIPSADHPRSKAPTSLTSVDRPRPTFNRIDNLHNFGVALELLRNFGEGNEVLAPLKAICGGLKVLVDIAETIRQNDHDIHDLHMKLDRQLGNLEQQYTTLLATKSKVAGKEVDNLVKALELDLNKIQEILTSLKNEDNRHDKKLFKKVWKYHSTREDIKGCSRLLDDSFAQCTQTMIGFIAHQAVMMRNDLADDRANDAINRLPRADARGNQHESCLKGTRVDILERIAKWYIENAAHPVLGLVDQAGTGKSTISAHMARRWEKEGIPTARFFFSLPKSVTTGTDFATTLARDMANSNTSLRAFIIEAVNEHQDISGHSIEEKLEWFVLTPLRRLRDGYLKVLGRLREDLKKDLKEGQSHRKAQVDLLPEVTQNATVSQLDRSYATALEEARRHPEDISSLKILTQTYIKYTEGLKDAYTEALAHPPVIIIDALDECSVSDRSTLLSTIFNCLTSDTAGFKLFKLFITCRPEADIVAKLRDPRYSNLFRRLDFGMINKSPSNHSDITLYAKQHLSGILNPSQITLFVSRADGFFIWASTAKAFLHEALDPSALFNSLVVQKSTSSPLDSLYENILRSAAERVGSSQLGLLKKVLQAVCVAQEPLSTRGMDEILGLGSGVASRVVMKLGSVLSDGRTVQVLHPTFIEYVRAGRQPHNLRFAEDEAEILLASGCLDILCSRQLKYDICCITKPLECAPRNLDIEDLHHRIDENTTPGLRYAVLHGISHAALSLKDNAVLTRLRGFFEKSLLYSMELLSFLGAIFRFMQMVHHLKSGLEGLGTHPTGALILENKQWCEDIVGFIQPFQAVLEESAMQVYFSALPFAPSNSKITHFYRQRFMKRTPKILRGPVTSKSITLAGHEDRIHCLAFSPDGIRLATGSEDRTVRLWDVATGAAIGEPLDGHTQSVTCLSFSPDGRRIASGSYDRTLRLWNIATSMAIGEPLVGHTNGVTCLSFSPDSQLLVSGSRDGNLRLWDVATDTVVGKPLTGHTDRINCLTFSPDGRIIASGSKDRTVRLWDIATGEPIGEPLNGHTNWVTCLSISPDGRKLVSGSRDGTLRLWDLVAGKYIGQPLAGHNNGVTCLSFSPDGRMLASGSRDGTLCLWDVITGAAIGKPLNNHTDCINCLSFSPDGSRLASGADDKMVYLWDAKTGATIGEPLDGHTDWVTCISFSPDGRTLASGSDDNTGRLWDVETSTAVGKAQAGHNGRVRSLSFSPDGRILSSGSEDRAVCLWDATSGAVISKLPIMHEGWVQSLSFSPDSRTLASGADDRTVRLWDVATGAAIGKALYHEWPIRSLSFNSHISGVILAINGSEAAWNISVQPPTKVHSIQETTQYASPLSNQVHFKDPWTRIESSVHIDFVLPSSFRCAEFLSHKGLLAYGGADGSVIIVDCSHII